MRLTRVLSLDTLYLAYSPRGVVVILVNEMRQHFHPVGDLCTLTIRLDSDHYELLFIMELPLEEHELPS